MGRKQTQGPWKAVEHHQRIGLTQGVPRAEVAGRWRVIAEARVAEVNAVMGNDAPECDLIAVLPALSEHNAKAIERVPDMIKLLDKWVSYGKNTILSFETLELLEELE